MMDTPSSSEMEAENDTCAYCGAEVPTDEWHPVLTVDDGSRIVMFCDENCRDAWRDTPHDG